MDEPKKDTPKTPAFHTKGVRWRYSDGTVLVIGPDGVARKPEPRVRQSKKARRRQRAKRTR